MIVLTTEEQDGVLLVELDGVLDPGGPALVVDHLDGLRDEGPLVVQLSHLDDPSGPVVAELLWRLESCVGSDGLALVHGDLDARRSLRARTTIPVLPTTGEALHGHGHGICRGAAAGERATAPR